MFLRGSRDAYLLTNKLGRLFVDAYYRHAPPVADFIGKHEMLKAMVRINLLPIVGISYSFVNFVPAIAMTMLLLVLTFPLLLVAAYRRRM